MTAATDGRRLTRAAPTTWRVVVGLGAERRLAAAEVVGDDHGDQQHEPGGDAGGEAQPAAPGTRSSSVTVRAGAGGAPAVDGDRGGVGPICVEGPEASSGRVALLDPRSGPAGGGAVGRVGCEQRTLGMLLERRRRWRWGGPLLQPGDVVDAVAEDRQPGLGGQLLDRLSCGIGIGIRSGSGLGSGSGRGSGLEIVGAHGRIGDGRQHDLGRLGQRRHGLAQGVGHAGRSRRRSRPGSR